MSELICKRQNFYIWGGGVRHGMAEYDNDDHAFEQMKTPEYFGAVHDLVKAGDYVRVTDCNHKLTEIHIDEVDSVKKTVLFSVIRDLVLVPVALEGDGGFAVRWRGPHSKWCVLDAAGGVVEKGFASRPAAERTMAVLADRTPQDKKAD